MRHRPAMLCAAIVSTIAVASTAADACSCRPRSYQAVLAATPIVFEGAVVKSVKVGGRFLTTLRVVKSIKGDVGRTVTVTTGTSGPACGYDFRNVKGTVRVGARRNEAGALTTNRCTMFVFNRSSRR